MSSYPFGLWGEPGHIWLLRMPSSLALRLAQGFLLRMAPILIIGASSIEPLFVLVAWSETLQLAQTKTPFWPVETSLVTSFECNCAGGLGLATCWLLGQQATWTKTHHKTNLFSIIMCLLRMEHMYILWMDLLCVFRIAHMYALCILRMGHQHVHNVAIMCFVKRR